MKARCKETQGLIELMDESLSGQDRKGMEAHLRECGQCRSVMRDFRQIDRVLSRTKRPKPSAAWLRSYHEALKSRFQPQPRPALKHLNRFWFNPSPSMRLAQAFGMMIFGVSLGWLIFHSPAPVTRGEPDIIVMSRTLTETQQVHTFFQESEIWLLDMMNLPQNASLDNEEWTMSAGQAAELLQKIGRIRVLTRHDQQSLKLDTYLDGLEMLLLEMINSREKDRSEKITEIRQAITDLDLLFRNHILFDHFQSVTPQA
jgi:hypothetical protein